MAHPLDTYSFIQNSKLVHGSAYDYSKTEYVNCKTKVTITCPTHGDFTKLPSKHTSTGQGCPECSMRNLSARNSSSPEHVINMCREVHGDLYSYDNMEYINNRIPFAITCKDHGDFLLSHRDHVSRKSGCPRCRGLKKMS